MNSVIYQIINLQNGNRYVGSAVDFEKRISRHKITLRKNKHYNVHLQYAWNKYGEKSFGFFILQKSFLDNKKKTLLISEQFWIDYFRKLYPTKLYNSYLVAGSPQGSKHSEETKKKISASESGVRNWNHKLNYEKVDEMRRMYDTGNYSQKMLSEFFNISIGCVGCVLSNRNWYDENYKREKKDKLVEASRWTKGERHKDAKLTLEQVKEIREKYDGGGYFFKDLASEYGITKGSIQLILQNKNWHDPNYIRQKVRRRKKCQETKIS